MDIKINVDYVTVQDTDGSEWRWVPKNPYAIGHYSKDGELLEDYLAIQPYTKAQAHQEIHRLINDV